LNAAIDGLQLAAFDGANPMGSGAGSKALEIAQANLATMRAVAEARAGDETLIDGNRTLWARTSQLIAYGQNSAGMATLMRNDPAPVDFRAYVAHISADA
jgi:hypothetical protein